MGYKTKSLQELESYGLPTLKYHLIKGRRLDFVDILWARKINDANRWSCRTDYPFPKEGLPCLTVDDTTDKELVQYSAKTFIQDPLTEYLLSESPNKQGRAFNAVVFSAGDELLGEISYSYGTLRANWVAGKLIPVTIDGGIGDYIVNKDIDLSHIPLLRKIRRLILGHRNTMFEITANKSGRLIFWQMIKAPDYNGWYYNNLWRDDV